MSTSSSVTPSNTSSPSEPVRDHKRSNKWPLRLLLGLSVITTGIVIYSGYHASAESPATESTTAAPPAPKVTVAIVEPQTVIDHRELLGRVEARETVEVRPRVSGHIENVRLQAGQRVKQGDVLFVIDPRWYQAAFDLAKANVESAQVRIRIKERDATRAADLLKSRAISIEESEARQAELDEARAALHAAQATFDSARLDLEHTVVRSPIAGQISRAYVTEGNLVSGLAGSATLLAAIVSTGDMHVYADVDESTLLIYNQLAREKRLPVEQGRVLVEMQLADEEQFGHRGYIESADNRLDAGTGSLVLRMVFPNTDGKLVPGLSARVRLPVSAPEPHLLVNERAIGTNQSQKFVLTVTAENTVAYKSVKIGPLIGGKRVISQGLQSGDRVIVNGLQRVSAGMTVVPETASSVAMK